MKNTFGASTFSFPYLEYEAESMSFFIKFFYFDVLLSQNTLIIY